MKLFRRLAAALALLLLALAAAVAVYAWRALPLTQGELRLQGLQGELRIERDGHGIPTVRAGNLHDLMFGVGVAHAQDRLWQMETHRRIGAGRLAQAFGEGALETDRFLRALGVRRAAQAQWAQMKGESRELLSAYTAGVNAWVRQQLQARPPEFLLLNLPLEDWSEVDSLAWAIMMAWDLGGNWNTELMRMRLAMKLPLSRINELLPPYPGDAPPATADYPALYREWKLDAGSTQQAWQHLQDVAPPSGVEGVGSNNWVLAGSRSSSGTPLLANDPHLKLSAPALWYFMRLEAPGLKVAGATLPGLPLVVLGQNDKLAWGFTNTGPDVQDLYIEQLRPEDPTQYRTPQGWARLEAHDEVIQVKGQPDLKISHRRSRHGPLLSDAGIADGLTGPKAQPTHVLALRWTALDADNDPIATGLGLMRASTVREFEQATQGWVAPMQNMVVADVQGRIGFAAAGRVPLRRSDNDLMGVAPAPGWDERYDWAGWVPADQTPREFDPPRGYIATANQRIHAPDYPHFISREWELPYRMQRIEQMLAAKDKHSLDDLRRMQADVKSLAAQPLLPWLQRARSSHPLAAAAQRSLAGFDGTMAADSAAPLIFWAWVRQLTEGIFADELGAAFYQRNIARRSLRDALEGVLQRDDAWWCDNKMSPEPESCAQQADAAFTRALEELQQLQGADVSAWRWGAAHQARSEHRPFSNVKALAGIFELRQPMGGDSFTVNVAKVSLVADRVSGERYLDEHGPSLRALYDVAAPKNSRVIHSTGQSGLFFSPHYRSFAPAWGRVEDVPLWTQEAPARVLTLRP